MNCSEHDDRDVFDVVHIVGASHEEIHSLVQDKQVVDNIDFVSSLF